MLHWAQWVTYLLVLVLLKGRQKQPVDLTTRGFNRFIMQGPLKNFQFLTCFVKESIQEIHVNSLSQDIPEQFALFQEHCERISEVFVFAPKHAMTPLLATRV